MALSGGIVNGPVSSTVVGIHVRVAVDEEAHDLLLASFGSPVKGSVIMGVPGNKRSN